MRNLNKFPEHLIEFCFDLLSKSKEDETSPFLCSFLTDYYESKIKETINIKASEIDNDKIANLKLEIKHNYEQGINILQLLSSKYDLMREKYWLYIIKKWKNKYESCFN